MFDLRTKLLDLDEDLERLTWGVQAARAVSAAISLDHAYGEGLYAVSDYLYEAQKKFSVRYRCLPDAIRSLTEALHHPSHRTRPQRRPAHEGNALPQP